MTQYYNHQAPYDVLQARHLGAWEDFSTLRDEGDFMHAKAVVDTNGMSSGFQDRAFRIVGRVPQPGPAKPVIKYIKVENTLTREMLDAGDANTEWAREEAEQLLYIGSYNNNWRGRRVDVYQSPLEEDAVVTVATKVADHGMDTVCVENKSAYQSRIDNNDWSDYN